MKKHILQVMRLFLVSQWWMKGRDYRTVNITGMCWQCLCNYSHCQMGETKITHSSFNVLVHNNPSLITWFDLLVDSTGSTFLKLNLLTVLITPWTFSIQHRQGILAKLNLIFKKQFHYCELQCHVPISEKVTVNQRRLAPWYPLLKKPKFTEMNTLYLYYKSNNLWKTIPPLCDQHESLIKLMWSRKHLSSPKLIPNKSSDFWFFKVD